MVILDETIVEYPDVPYEEYTLDACATTLTTISHRLTKHSGQRTGLAWSGESQHTISTVECMHFKIMNGSRRLPAFPTAGKQT